MKSLSAALAAAWRGVPAGGAAEPYVRCLVDDRLAAGLRFEWSEVYNAGADPGDGHGAVVTAAGTIVRARLISNGVNEDVQTQRVTDPSQAAQWASWTTRVAGVTTIYADVSVAAVGTTITVWFARQNGANFELCSIASTDDGQTWGGVTVRSTVAGTIGHVSAAVSPDGSGPMVAYTHDAGAGFKVELYVTIGGAAFTYADPGAAYTLSRGIAVVATSTTSVAIVVAGNQGGASRLSPRAVTGLTGAGAPTWTSGIDFARHSADAASWLRNPRLAALAPPGGTADYPGYCLTYTETDGFTATLFGAFARQDVPASPPFFLAPYVLASVTGGTGPQAGGILLKRSGSWWLVTYGSGRSSPVWTGAVAGDQADVSARVVAFEEQRRQARDGQRGSRLIVVLDNTDGALAAGAAGAYRCLRAGSRLALGYGYRWTGGAETVWGEPWVVERTEFRQGQGTDRLILHCAGAAAALRQSVLANDVGLGNVTLLFLLQRALGRVAETSGLTDTRLNRTAFGVTLRARETLAGLAANCAEAAGLWLRYATAGASAAPTGFADWCAAATVRWDDATVHAAYGPNPATQGPIRAGRHAGGAARANRVRVAGTDPQTVATATDAANSAVTATDGWRSERRVLAGDGVWVADLAAWELARAREADAAGSIESSPHPGLELFDIISISAPRAGLNAAPRRVVGITTRYDRLSGEWAQQLDLAGV